MEAWQKKLCKFTTTLTQRLDLTISTIRVTGHKSPLVLSTQTKRYYSWCGITHRPDPHDEGPQPQLPHLRRQGLQELVRVIPAAPQGRRARAGRPRGEPGDAHQRAPAAGLGGSTDDVVRGTLHVRRNAWRAPRECSGPPCS